MSTQSWQAPGDLLDRAGRWLAAKVWLGCLLSGLFALGRHFGWPEALVSAMAALGALGLAVAAVWLPVWTREYRIGIPVVDIGLRLIVWAGLAAAVVSLLIGDPAVGTVAGALLLSTAWRTFGRSSETVSQRGRIPAPPGSF
ncbi:hypothetical protein [Cryptosporangium sp. NPDC051539]|uniref:hypothetical protein n=1 Tax=Cryptosporangium sp. NPDC051539 TaxID=3363962 RepID=UPI00379C79BB